MNLSDDPRAVRKRKWLQANREKARQYTRDWRAKNRERARELSRDRKRATMSTPDGRVRHLLAQAKRRALQNGLSFTITIADLLPLPTHCPALGLPLNYAGGSGKHGGFHDPSASIDRIDSSRGYEPGNVRIVSWRANRIKADATINELRAIFFFMQNGGEPCN